MRRPIIRAGICASIGSAKLVHMLEERLETARFGLDVALDFGLDILAKQETVRIVRLVRQIEEEWK